MLNTRMGHDYEYSFVVLGVDLGLHQLPGMLLEPKSTLILSFWAAFGVIL